MPSVVSAEIGPPLCIVECCSNAWSLSVALLRLWSHDPVQVCWRKIVVWFHAYRYEILRIVHPPHGDKQFVKDASTIV
jgi:hypothetical protein